MAYKSNDPTSVGIEKFLQYILIDRQSHSTKLNREYGQVTRNAQFRLLQRIEQFSEHPDAHTIYKKAEADIHEAWNRYFAENRTMNSPSQPTPNSNLVSLQNPSSTATQQPRSVPQSSPQPTMPNPKITFGLKNAKVGELYSSELQIQGESEHKKVLIKKVVLPDGVGLAPDVGNIHKISGTPLKDGEFKVTVQYQFQDARPEHPIISVEFNLFVNPDPKSLWKYIEPDQNDPYFKKNEDKNLILGNDNQIIVAASRRGRSHEHSGTFRDDDFLLASAHGWDIIAVADGAGSAKSSRKGSEIAVRTSVEYLLKALDQNTGRIEQESGAWFANQSGSPHALKTALYEAFGRAAFASVKAIEEEASSKSLNVKEFSTTLILAGHKKFPFGHFFAAYWVGDGGVGVYQKGKAVQLLGEVDSGEFAGQTRFLDKQVMTAEEVMKRMRFAITDDFTSLILMTDGVTDPKFETDNNLANLQKWDELWSELEPITADKDLAAGALLRWLEFWSPGNHDDRTIAMLYK